MAIVTAVSIGTSNKVSIDYQSQEVSVNLTYELERGDADVLAFVEEKSAEVEKAHSAIWRRIRELRAEAKEKNGESQPGSAAYAGDGKRRSGAEKERGGRRRNGLANGAEPANDIAPAETIAVDTLDNPPAEDDPVSSTAQQRAILSLANLAGMSDASLTEILVTRFEKSTVDQLTRNEAARFLVDLQRRDRGEFLAAQAR